MAAAAVCRTRRRQTARVCRAPLCPGQLLVDGHAVYPWHHCRARGASLCGGGYCNYDLGRWAVISMARRDRSAQPDGQVQQILDLLTAYERTHPQAQIEGRRHNPVSIRLRIIDPDFQGMDRIEREAAIWKLLRQLPEEVFVNITILLLLTPEETEHSLASQEFDHPIPSRLGQ